MENINYTKMRWVPVFIEGWQRIKEVISRKNATYVRGAYYNEENEPEVKWIYLSVPPSDRYVECVDLLGKDLRWFWIHPDYPNPKLNVLRYLPMSLSESFELHGERVLFFDIKKGKAYECDARFLLFETKKIFYVKFEGEEEEIQLAAEDYMRDFAFLDPHKDLMR